MKPTIDVIEKGRGWLIVKLREGKASAAVTVALHDKLMSWLQTHPDVIIRAALPFVSDGETISVHVWYDEAATPQATQAP